MKLISLKQKYSDMDSPTTAKSDNDAYYPSIYLSEKQIAAMGIDFAKVGTELTMMATIRVSSINQNKTENSMSFEIIEAAVEPKEKKPDAASVLFPNG